MHKRWTIALLLACALQAQAQEAPVTVTAAWARPTVQGQVSSGAYMTITTREPLLLTGASTPVAGLAEVHEMRMDGDIMRMRTVDSLALAPGQPVELKPGSYHVMLQQLRAPLQVNTSIPVTLHFRTAAGARSEARISVPVSATAPAARR